MLQLHNFVGAHYRLANNWFYYVPLHEYQNRPIRYLEIGAFFGANLLSVAQTYGSHPDSELHCIDPWEDYPEYSEFRNEQPIIYDTFLKNIENSPAKDKVRIHRGHSHIEIPKFQDEYFDIIYIDGNHEPEYVVEDAVLSMRKLKKGGILIFDDYGWGGPDVTQRGIDAFLSGYHRRIIRLGEQDTQVFVQKR